MSDLALEDLRGRGRLGRLAAVGGVDQAVGGVAPAQARLGRDLELVVGVGLQVDGPVRPVSSGKLLGEVVRTSAEAAILLAVGHPVSEVR